MDALLARMTLDEKLTLIRDSREDPATYQGQAGYIAGIPRLGIPGLRLADGPPGVLTRHPSAAETATMGLAATFDLDLARQNGEVIGREAKALGIDMALQPYINIDRDLTFRRAYNTYGEDPLLTGEIGAAVITGIQSQGVMAVAKHFIGYDGLSSNVFIGQQALHEVYLPPFEAAVKAGVAAVMCSYNHINGPYSCGSRATLTDILRGELKFPGIVISDWGATHSALFLKDGLDMEMIDGPDSSGYQEPAFLGAVAAALPPPPDSSGEDKGDIYGGTIPEEPAASTSDTDIGEKVTPKTVGQALADGSISEADITRAAGHVLSTMDRFGLLDGKSKHDITLQAVDANAAIIRKTAEEAAVLLKNDGVLPLKAADLSSAVLIGPTAGQVDAIGINGERSMGLIERQIGPLEAMRRISGNSDIRFAVADDMTGDPIPAELLSHDGQAGLLYAGPGGTRTDAMVNFTVTDGNALTPNLTASWHGTLTVPKTGNYWLYLQALGTDASLYIDGKRVGITGTFQGDVHGDILQANQDNVIPTTDGLDNVRHAQDLTAGAHAIEVRVSPDTSNAPVQIRLSWYTPGQRETDHAAAIDAARHAKTAIVFVWARRLPAFFIPGDQIALVNEIAAVNRNTIVVLNTSQPVPLPFSKKVRAILDMWWPGDEGGWATADLLLGKANPSGRLPVTWASRLEDYPATDPAYPERSSLGVDQKTTYSEGVYVGYRWFDRSGTAPLFPFGHGLSYTRFTYSNLATARAGDGGLDVSFTLTNSGGMEGDEVAQVYLGAPELLPANAEIPVHTLAAFARVHLKAGESKSVTIHVPPRQLQYWSVTDKGWHKVSGRRAILIGSSSRDFHLKHIVDYN